MSISLFASLKAITKKVIGNIPVVKGFPLTVSYIIFILHQYIIPSYTAVNTNLYYVNLFTRHDRGTDFIAVWYLKLKAYNVWGEQEIQEF
jgi:hypothetical protein